MLYRLGDKSLLIDFSNIGKQERNEIKIIQTMCLAGQHDRCPPEADCQCECH